MHPAKKFFYVCAGLFLLAVSYHLGVRSAGAQVSSTVDCVGVDHNIGGSAVINGMLWFSDGAGRLPEMVPVPVPGHAIACSATTVLLDDGNWFYWSGAGGYWIQGANAPLPFGGAVTVQQHTLGQLKARFRDSQPQGR